MSDQGFTHERFLKQIGFLVEIDRLKGIVRKTRNFHNKHYENDAEHSWHISMMALVLAEYANDDVDISKVIKMTLIHDLVEIDAGDTYLYDSGQKDKVERERKAAARLFGMLPDDQREEYSALWEEFETKETPEARFAGAMDRLMPVMQNYHDNGHAWQEHGVTSNMVRDVNSQIGKGSKVLWEYAASLIEQSVERGYLKK